MNYKVNTTLEAAYLVRDHTPPFEIQIPDNFGVGRFINGVNYYLEKYGWWAQMSDAKRDHPTVYVKEKGKAK